MQKRKYIKRGQVGVTKQSYRRMEKIEEELHSKRVCPACDRTLRREHWNTSVDILFCDNAGCPKYRHPGGTAPIIKTTMTQLVKEMEHGS